jgi:hypothetical protein
VEVQIARAIERTTELQLIKDKRHWTPLEKEEFFSLLTLLHENAMRKFHEDRERTELKKKRVRPLRIAGIH